MLNNEFDPNNRGNIHLTMGGVFTFYSYKLDEDGNPTPKTWLNTTNNMILDYGLADIVHNDFFLEYIHLGTGISMPNPLQTYLDNKVLATKGDVRLGDAYSEGVLGDGTNPYYRITKTFRVPPRDEDYTYTEVGVGSNTTQLFSRSLLKNNLNIPEPVFIPAGHYIEIVYQLTVYIPAGTTTAVITPTGDTSDDITVTIKAANVKDANKESTGSWNLNRPYEYNVAAFNTRSLLSTANSSFGFGSGPITSTISGYPSVDYNHNKKPIIESVDGPTAVIKIWSKPTENTGSIQCAVVTIGFFTFQVEFNPPIIKGKHDEMTIHFKLSWGRVVE